MRENCYNYIASHNIERGEIKMDYRSKMKHRREELGMTLEQVADELGTSKQTIQRYESGEIKTISIPKIERIAKILKIDPVELLGWTKQEEPPKNVTLAAHRTDGYGIDLPEDAQKELNSYIEFLKMKYKKKD